MESISITDLQKLPTNPGVYIFRNSKSKVLYVGKAVNLQSRVKSYFANKDSLTAKTKALVEKITKIDHIKVENEIEALLLEAELIKRFRPPYNINLKDDKFYKFIKIEKDKISTTRKIDEKSSKATYLGPFPESTSISIILKTLRRVFPYRDCSIAKFNRYKKAKKPCLYGHIGLCPAPCQGIKEEKINEDNIKKVKEYIKGDRVMLFKKLESEMKLAAKEHNFEKAAYLRDQIASYNYLTQEKRNIKEYIKSPELIDDLSESSVKSLILLLEDKTNLKFQNKDIKSFRIEIFDISNIQGKNAVGAMVVLTGGIPDKKEYRKFKINTKDTPDDFSMMQEILDRRFKGKGWAHPDLIVIDGGKGQLSSAIEVLQKHELKIPIIGLAKRFENIIFAKNSGFESIDIPNSSSAIKILQKGRDEAHRFGITYYRKLHREKLYK